MSSLINYFKNFQHYFRLFKQIYIRQSFNTSVSYLKAKYWGVNLSGGCTFVGIPKFRKTPNSEISIGYGTRMLSSFTSNLHGINRKCMLSTLKPQAKIILGENVGMSGVVIAAASQIKIGNRVMIGANCTISDTNSHSILYQERHPTHFGLDNKNFVEEVKVKPIDIADDVFIGMNCLILKGAKIGRGSVIAAGSIVTGNIPEGVIAGGVPAIVLKKIDNKYHGLQI